MRAAVRGDEGDQVADQHLGLLGLPEEAELGLVAAISASAVATSSSQVSGRGANLSARMVSVVEHAGIDEPGQRGELALQVQPSTIREDSAFMSAAMKYVVERQRPSGVRELGDPDDVLGEDVRRAGAAGELLDQLLMHFGGAARRRQLGIGHMDQICELLYRSTTSFMESLAKKRALAKVISDFAVCA